jgi:hypothetical protein
MKATKLVGKWAIRTKRTRGIGDGRIGDGSYTDSPIFILKATDNHIIFEHYETFLRDKRPSILNDDFCDNNWIDYKKLIKLPFWVKVLKIIAYKFIK